MDKKNRFKLPEENVEYTFVFPGNNSSSMFEYHTYVYQSQLPKGRLRFMDTKLKKFTDFSGWKFNNLLKKQLVSKKQLEGYKPTVVPKRSDNTDKLLTANYYTDILRSLGPSMAASIMAIIGYHPSKLADEFEELGNENANYTDAYNNRVLGNMTRAFNYIDACARGESTIAPNQSVSEEPKPELVAYNELKEKLSSICKSMRNRCKAHFGYDVEYLISKINEYSQNEKFVKPYCDSAERVLRYVELQKQAEEVRKKLRNKVASG